jgi:hypothetical protein
VPSHVHDGGAHTCNCLRLGAKPTMGICGVERATPAVYTAKHTASSY